MHTPKRSFVPFSVELLAILAGVGICLVVFWSIVLGCLWGIGILVAFLAEQSLTAEDLWQYPVLFLGKGFLLVVLYGILLCLPIYAILCCAQRHRRGNRSV